MPRMHGTLALLTPILAVRASTMPTMRGGSGGDGVFAHKLERGMGTATTALWRWQREGCNVLSDEEALVDDPLSTRSHIRVGGRTRRPWGVPLATFLGPRLEPEWWAVRAHGDTIAVFKLEYARDFQHGIILALASKHRMRFMGVDTNPVLPRQVAADVAVHTLAVAAGIAGSRGMTLEVFPAASEM